MTDNSLRTAIARALFESDLEAWPAETREHEWPTSEPGYLTQADAVLAVLADPPEFVIERVKNRIMQDFGYVDYADSSSFGGDGFVDVREAFRAAFGGEQSDER